MILRLLSEFRHSSRAGIALMTACLMPLIMVMMFTANDFGRYYMYSRYFSSAAQQANEWMTQSVISSGKYDKNAANAAVKAHFDDLIKSTGIVSDSVTFAYNSSSKKSRLVAKAKYNLFVSKLLNINSFPLVAEAGSYHPVKQSLFVSIVFSSGEMRSEGDYIYGNYQTSSLYAGRGVSESNDYYRNFIGGSVTARSTPTHNYYVTAALVKEIIARNADKDLYISMIPASATVNLNPSDYNASPKGSKEGKLPTWVFGATGFRYHAFNDITNTTPICITNRDFNDTAAYGTPKSNYTVPYTAVTGDIFYWYPTYLHDIYRISASELNTTIPINANNWFTHDELLMDNGLPPNIESSVTWKNLINGNMPPFYAEYLHTRAYPHYSFASGRCPANNATPALASFQKVTSPDYPAINTTYTASVTENEIFWDYMRNHIDPDKTSNFYIWGSPNIAFGMQIAYENIAYVQYTKKINNNGADYDPDNSEFQVFVVSDQIGGVKNAGGSMVVWNQYEIMRVPNINNCTNFSSTIDLAFPYDYVKLSCMPILPWDYVNYQADPVPSDMQIASFNKNNPPFFKFTHMWWDNSFDLSGPGCLDIAMYNPFSCDIVRSATPYMVVKHFYNIINYAVDLRYNRDRSKTMIRPKAYFVDTGSGKTSDDCQASNRYTMIFYLLNWGSGSISNDAYLPLAVQNPGGLQQLINIYDAKHYQQQKPCMAHVEMSGYRSDYNYSFETDDSSYYDYEGGLVMLEIGAVNNFPRSSYGTNIDKHINNVTDLSGSGFDRIFSYEYVQPNYLTYSRRVDILAPRYLPISYYSPGNKIYLRSNSLDQSPYNSPIADRTVRDAAKGIATHVMDHLYDGPIIPRPF